MISKIDLETIPYADVSGLINAYATILAWSEFVPSMKSENKKAQAMLQRLFEQIDERVITCRTIHNPVTGNWAEYPVIAKTCEGATYCSNGEFRHSIFGHSTPSLYLDPWEPKDPKVLSEYSKILGQGKLVYEQKQTGEIKSIYAEERLKDERKKYRSTYGRQDHLLVKYQIYQAEGKQLQRLPDRFKLNGKLFWEVMEEVENAILLLTPSSYNTEEKKQAVLKRFATIEELLSPLYYSIMRLFSYARHYDSYETRYNETDYCTTNASLTVSIYTLKNAEIAQECVRKQSFTYTRPDTSWLSNYDNKEYRTFDAVDLSRFNAIDRIIESRYQRQTICSLLFFYETAKQRFDNEKVYLLRDFCTALGIIKPKEEKHVGKT